MYLLKLNLQSSRQPNEWNTRYSASTLAGTRDSYGIVGGREIFDRMLQNHWLKPRIKQRKLVRYAAEDLVAAVEHLKSEDLPE